MSILEYNPPYYESTAIGHHYRSKKSQALAYLMTIGSKALVLMEVSEDNTTDTTSHLSVRKTFDDESAIKRNMEYDDQVRQFQRAVFEKPGVPALKRGRNGGIRPIHMRLKLGRNGNSVVWRSRMGSKKYFSLDDSLEVHCREVEGVDTSSSTSSSFQVNIPILELRNNTRSLQIQFFSVNESAICKNFLQSQFPASSSSSSSSSSLLMGVSSSADVDVAPHHHNHHQ